MARAAGHITIRSKAVNSGRFSSRPLKTNPRYVAGFELHYTASLAGAFFRTPAALWQSTSMMWPHDWRKHNDGSDRDLSRDSPGRRGNPSAC